MRIRICLTNIKKNLFAIVLLSLANALYAQQNGAFNFTFDHVALSVTDVNQAATFCAEVLKLQEITNRSKLDGVRWFSLGPQRELHLIAIIKEPVKANKAVHVALTTSNFDAFIKTLEEKKIPYSDWPGQSQTFNVRADGVKQVFFQGFDGYWFEVNSVTGK